MAGSYLIDAPRGIVFSRGWGYLTDGEILEHARRLAADPRFASRFSQVTDFRDLSELRVTAKGVQRVSESNPFRRDARRAFVVASNEAFGMVRMFEQFADAEPGQFAVFRTLEPAMAWVGLEPSSCWPAAAPDETFGLS